MISGIIGGSLAGLEEARCNDVGHTIRCEVGGIDNGLLGATRRVGDRQRGHRDVGAPVEVEEVVGNQQIHLQRSVQLHHQHTTNQGHNTDDGTPHGSELLGIKERGGGDKPTTQGHEDTGGHSQQNGSKTRVTKTRHNLGSKSDQGTIGNVDAQRKHRHDVCLPVSSGLDDAVFLEIGVSGSGSVLFGSVDSNVFFSLGEEATADGRVWQHYQQDDGEEQGNGGEHNKQ